MDDEGARPAKSLRDRSCSLQTSGSPISAALRRAPSRARNVSPRLHVHSGATPRSVKKASLIRPCSDRRSPAMLTGRCLAEPSALDGRCTQMVTLQIAEPLCPRDRLVGGVLHPFRHGNAAETADPL